MIKVYLYDLDNLKDSNEYMYRQRQARKERRPASLEYKDAGSKDIVNLGVTAALSEALKEYGVLENDMDFVYGNHGKPYLRNKSGVFLNISHSGKYVMCAAGDVEMGIDIQKHVNNRRHIAKRFFSENEYKKIENICELKEADKLFFDMWSVKESYVKATGEGIGDSFKDIEVMISKDGVINVVYKNVPVSYVFKKYEIDGYSAVVCACVPSEISEIIVINKVAIHGLVDLGDV